MPQEPFTYTGTYIKSIWSATEISSYHIKLKLNRTSIRNSTAFGWKRFPIHPHKKKNTRPLCPVNHL